MTPTLHYCSARLARLRVISPGQPFGTSSDAATFARLAAESDALKRQEALALAADITSALYRDYVSRLQSHIVALAAYLGTSLASSSVTHPSR